MHALYFATHAHAGQTGKAIDRAHRAAAPARAQTIEMADLIDSSKSIFERDPRFARRYVREKELLLHALTLADPMLICIAKMQFGELMGIVRLPDISQR